VDTAVLIDITWGYVFGALWRIAALVAVVMVPAIANLWRKGWRPLWWR
jgi:hypothetical protein